MESFDTAPSATKDAEPAGKIGVIVMHGMGQQTRFETMVEVADGIRRAHADRTGKTLDSVPKATARSVSINDKVTPRLELELSDPERRIDIYEAYWAPLTEGAIGVMEVIGFLLFVGRNRMLSFRKTYQRILFGASRDLTVESATPVYLLLALLTIGSLIFVNTVIGLAAALKAGIARKDWLEHSLPYLTAAAGLLCVAAVAFVCALLVGTRLQRMLSLASASPSRFTKMPYLMSTFMAFFSLLLTVILAGATMGLTALAESSFGSRVPATGRFAASVATLLAGFVVATIAFALVAALSVLLVSVVYAARSSALRTQWLFTAVLSLVGIIFGFSLLRPTAAFLHAFRPSKPVEALSVILDTSLFRFIELEFNPASWMAIWAVLFWLSKKVRELIIQYAGDVAIYIASQRLDRFDRIRAEIKKVCCELATGVYGARSDPSTTYEYDKIVFVGHSLGSVIAYDTLNRLMLEDILQGEPRQIRQRTGGLLTFGSPLGKVAYLFAVQRQKGWNGQEALAHTLQPLIEDYRYRQYPWVNVHSTLDIISGPLQGEFDVHDTDSIPEGSHRIRDIDDPEAIVPIVHHTHYWRGRVIWKELWAMLT